MTDYGPIYGVELLASLPLDGGPMKQALPSRRDLDDVLRSGIAGDNRVVAGFEVLTEHYRRAVAEVERLRGFMEAVASMPGRDWIGGQMALADALTPETARLAGGEAEEA
jgi:hypothetical protein